MCLAKVVVVEMDDELLDEVVEATPAVTVTTTISVMTLVTRAFLLCIAWCWSGVAMATAAPKSTMRVEERILKRKEGTDGSLELGGGVVLFTLVERAGVLVLGTERVDGAEWCFDEIESV